MVAKIVILAIIINFIDSETTSDVIRESSISTTVIAIVTIVVLLVVLVAVLIVVVIVFVIKCRKRKMKNAQTDHEEVDLQVKNNKYLSVNFTRI